MERISLKINIVRLLRDFMENVPDEGCFYRGMKAKPGVFSQ